LTLLDIAKLFRIGEKGEFSWVGHHWGETTFYMRKKRSPYWDKGSRPQRN